MTIAYVSFVITFCLIIIIKFYMLFGEITYEVKRGKATFQFEIIGCISIVKKAVESFNNDSYYMFSTQFNTMCRGPLASFDIFKVTI